MKDFKDKVVVITGGATGIGFAFAKAFGAGGAKIVIGALHENRLQEAIDKLAELGIEAKYTICDVTQPEQVEALADFSWNAFGHVDVIVNNAGTMLPPMPVIDTPLESVQSIFNVNFYGVWHGSSIFGKRLTDQGTPAAIYNIGSENSLFHGVPMGAAYVATKHAVLALTESLREEVPDFIEVGLVCPGFVRSELGPPEAMTMAMDTDRFVSIAMEQIKAGEFYIVSHAYNIERINARHDEIVKAYATYAPRYEGDDEFDVRSLMGRMQEAVDNA
ncbi:MAG: SDR family oxidoreductase [Candidatus Thiodiazotropha sp. (ex Clathrolucina costata)]|nr:SDR family oxidoreductase [Candidatus Thiodiazotropha taylori]MCG7863428.1 SDR family oxidoreductase [Candidatus Thiodiazotropha endolucinida]